MSRHTFKVGDRVTRVSAVNSRWRAADVVAPEPDRFGNVVVCINGGYSLWPSNDVVISPAEDQS